MYRDLKRPIMSLAPMEDVTDTVFRRVVASIERPTLFYTEFVNVEGLMSKGRSSVIHRLKYEQTERSIVAQLWGLTPEKFFEASKIVKEMGFDGIDINMGCSVQKVSTRGAGSGLIQADPGIVKDIVQAVKSANPGLPVSIKTRIGWKSSEVERWIGFLLELDVDAITVHGRTARGEGTVNANWDEIGRCVELRDSLGKDTLIFGNGDVTSMQQANEYAERYGVDGVMIGRAAISNPWVFSGREDISKEERLEVFKTHVSLFKEVWGDTKNFHSLKKFFRAYVNNFEGANEIRTELMMCNDTEELLEKIELLFL